jgi:phage terminase large subunit-like protein
LLPSLPLSRTSRPRVEVAPSSTASYGPAAVELARVAGLVLDQWQRDALELMLSVRADGKWACFEYAEIVSRQNGKGSILEARALAGLFLLGEQLIMWSAHEVKTALEAFRRLRSLLIGLGELVNENLIDVDGVHIKVNNTNGSEGFERLDTGQRVKFIARSKGSGRGFSGDVNIIDETFAYTDDQHSALLPTMSARPNPQIIYTSSPPLTGDTGEVLYRLRKRAAAGKGARLGFRDWGAEGDLSEVGKLDLDDRELWAATNPAYRIRIDEEFVQSERESMSDEKFGIERIGLWPKQLTGGGAIDPNDWLALLDPESRRHGDVAITVDIAPKRDYAAVGLYGNREDGLGHGQIVVYKAGTEWIVPTLVEWRDTVNPVGIGMGRAVYAYLEAELEKAGFRKPGPADEPQYKDLVVLNATEMTAAVGQFMDAVKQRTFRHLGQRELDASVVGAKVKETESAQVLVRKDADADTAPAVTLAEARWLFESRAHLVQEANYDVLESVF